MKRTVISEIFKSPESFDGKEIIVCGWAKAIRDHKSTAFIQLSDGSTHDPLQIVLTDSLTNYDEIVHQNIGAAFIVKGILKITPEAKQPFEIEGKEMIVEGTSSPDYPLQKKRHTLEYLRTIPQLRPRTNSLSATFRVRGVAAYAIHKFCGKCNRYIYAINDGWG